MSSDIPSQIEVRPIRTDDDPHIKQLIRTVMPEFGANGAGFAIVDPEVEAMSKAYTGEKSAYWVAQRDGRIIGGAGFAPLLGGEANVCELKKMYFYPEARGLGLGARLLEILLPMARDAGFEICYLETLKRMDRANRLYQRFGFKRIEAPMGNTGHFGCDCWYMLPLKDYKRA